MQHKNLKIAFVSKTQKVWFIRASSGAYAPNFKYAGIIAIKHLEDAMGKNLGNDLPSEEEIRRALLRNEKYFEFIEDNKTKKQKKTLNRQGHILLSQIRRFANDIEAGDVIVTKNEIGGYNIGICSDSIPYVDHSKVELPRPTDESPQSPVLSYKFRKKVIWGPSLQANQLPHTVRRATRGQQTISNLSDHRLKIFHLIYPFFTDGEHLYFSNKINKQGDINSLVIGKLFENLSLSADLIEKLTSDKDLKVSDILSNLRASLFDDNEFVACQAEFMSPGDLWCKIPLLDTADLTQQITAGVLVCLLLTGQAKAAGLESVADVNPDAEIVLQTNKETPSSTIFNEKFKAAAPSKGFKKLAKKLQNESDELKKLEKERSTHKIQGNLKLQVPAANTSKLEKFSYGINVIEIRGLSEDN